MIDSKQNTEAIKNIHQRMLAVYADVTSVAKEDKKVNGQYKYVSHDAVSKTLHMHLVEKGICLEVSETECEQDGNRTKVKLMIKFVNADIPTDFIEVGSYGYGIDPQDKGPGKATSYAFKKAMLKNFCLESCDEDVEKTHIDHKPTTLQTVSSVATYITPLQVKNLRDLLRISALSEEEFLKRAGAKKLEFLDIKRYEGALQYLSSNQASKHEGTTQ